MLEYSRNDSYRDICQVIRVLNAALRLNVGQSILLLTRGCKIGNSRMNIFSRRYMGELPSTFFRPGAILTIDVMVFLKIFAIVFGKYFFVEGV